MAFCHSCGAQLPANTKFCEECGTPLAQHTPVADTPVVVETVKPKKRGLSRVVIAMITIAVIAVAGAAAAIGITTLNAKKSEGQFIGELTQRLGTTPIAPIIDHYESLTTNGTVNVNFDVEDYWDNVYGDVTLKTDGKNKAFEITANVNDFALDLVANDKRAAINFPDFDAKYYGIDYETFERDFAAFGEEVGIDDYTIEQIVDAVKQISDALKNGSSSGFDKSEITAITEKFENGLKERSGTETVSVGGQEIKAKYTAYTISADDLRGLSEDFVDYLLSNAAFTRLLTTQGGYYGDLDDLRDEILDEIEYALADFEPITLKIYTYKSRTVLISTEFETDGNTYRLMLDFGLSALDDWTLDVRYTENYGSWSRDYIVKLVWSIEQSGDTYTNKITGTRYFIDSDDGYESNSTVVLKSVWNSKTGKFTLSAKEDDYEVGSFSGNMLPTKNGFELTLDLADAADMYTFDVKITASSGGVTIPDPTYVKIDKWDRDLLEEFDEFLNDNNAIADARYNGLIYGSILYYFNIY
ncbi:MAG: zinc ribbon domain-containing protein [Oscillospiraceae bacterium]|jgi:hypothetical protein|nr:zinc ribbon domain-containing protein [Oscillospiraceae bacterium]